MLRVSSLKLQVLPKKCTQMTDSICRSKKKRILTLSQFRTLLRRCHMFSRHRHSKVQFLMISKTCNCQSILTTTTMGIAERKIHLFRRRTKMMSCRPAQK